MGMGELSGVTVSYGMRSEEPPMSTLTIRLDAKLERQLNRLARQTRRSKSELVRQMLRKQLALASLEQARALLVPLAERAGYLTDEDVFRDIS
jgi:predicted transcriptional regulator